MSDPVPTPAVSAADPSTTSAATPAVTPSGSTPSAADGNNVPAAAPSAAPSTASSSAAPPTPPATAGPPAARSETDEKNDIKRYLHQKLRIVLKNASGSPGCFAVYMSEDGGTSGKIAWRSTAVTATGLATFSWVNHFSLIWSKVFNTPASGDSTTAEESGATEDATDAPVNPIATDKIPLYYVCGGVPALEHLPVINGCYLTLSKKNDGFTFLGEDKTKRVGYTLGAVSKGVEAADNVLLGLALDGKALQYKPMSGTVDFNVLKLQYYVCFGQDFIEGTVMKSVTKNQLVNFADVMKRGYVYTSNGFVENKTLVCN